MRKAKGGKRERESAKEKGVELLYVFNRTASAVTKGSYVVQCSIFFRSFALHIEVTASYSFLSVCFP